MGLLLMIDIKYLCIILCHTCAKGLRKRLAQKDLHKGLRKGKACHRLNIHTDRHVRLSA